VTEVRRRRRRAIQDGSDRSAPSGPPRCQRDAHYGPQHFRPCTSKVLCPIRHGPPDSPPLHPHPAGRDSNFVLTARTKLNRPQSRHRGHLTASGGPVSSYLRTSVFTRPRQLLHSIPVAVTDSCCGSRNYEILRLWVRFSSWFPDGGRIRSAFVPVRDMPSCSTRSLSEGPLAALPRARHRAGVNARTATETIREANYG